MTTYASTLIAALVPLRYPKTMAAAAAATKGDAFKAEGDAALKRSTIFGFGKTQKYEDAADAYTKAGNQYKLGNRWQSAGECFMKAGECHKTLGSETDAVGSIAEAGNCYKKLNPVEAIVAFQAAIDIYNAGGRFGRSAALMKEIAEIYEADGNVAGAIESFENAATLFANDNKKSVAQQCHLKIAALASGKDDFIKAAEIFEQVGRESMESNLSKYSAKNYLFQALLCFLAAQDTVTAKNKKEDYKNIDYTFAGQRECTFVEKLLGVIEANDAEGFAQACADFDRITPLDPWKTSMLLKAKKNIAGGGSEESDLC
jgi:alpha-soluble NSF attachment protein